MCKLDGKVALVTGGNSGIGRATSLAFAERGVRVVIAARDADRGAEVVKEIQDHGGESCFVSCDVSRKNDVANLIQTVVTSYGQLDFAFNNAGIETQSPVLMADLEEEEFDRTVTVNLKSVWLCMKYELAQMLHQTPVGGSIVNTSSVNGLIGVPKGSFYSATKAGVIAITEAAAQEYGPYGIRVNALVPGGIDTPMLDRTIKRRSDDDKQLAEQMRMGVAEMTPLRRIGRPEEVAMAVVWLCSDAASYITGHSMIIDGGLMTHFH